MAVGKGLDVDDDLLAPLYPVLDHGHGHIGLTLAPITAQIIAGLVAGKDTGKQIDAYSAGRF